ncbi:MAG TPA: hypothetical protein VGC79_07625, partial [Polyangiaceae bacterium]
MNAAQLGLYREFVEGLLYADTFLALRGQITASTGTDPLLAASAFDAVEADAERRGLRHTLELSQFVRANLADWLETPAVPSRVTGHDTLLAAAAAAANPIRVLA